MLDNFEEVVTPEQSRGILASHGARIDSLERWVEKQNGSIQRLGDEVKGLREDMHDKFDELKDLIHEVNKSRDSRIAQRIGWAIGLIVGIPSCLWSFIQVINFLSKR